MAISQCLLLKSNYQQLVLKSQILLKMTFSNSIQLKMIETSTVSRTQEAIKIDFLQILTAFWYSYMNCPLLYGYIKN